MSFEQPTDVRPAMSAARLNVAVAQFRPLRSDPSANATRLLDFLSRTDADLLVAPELCLSGYLLKDRAECAALALPADNPLFRRIADEALARTGAYLALGFAERDGDRLYNAAALLGPAGLVGVYRKTHLFADEADLFDPGDRGFPVWTLPGDVTVGMMICFDWMFPEAARSLALAGADIILHPANLVLPWCQQAMPVRALENRVYTVTANRIGTETLNGTSLRFTGGSIICGPDAAVLARASVDEELLLSATLEPACCRDKYVTARNHLFNDRRPTCYVVQDRTRVSPQGGV